MKICRKQFGEKDEFVTADECGECDEKDCPIWFLFRKKRKEVEK